MSIDEKALKLALSWMKPESHVIAEVAIRGYVAARTTPEPSDRYNTGIKQVSLYPSEPSAEAVLRALKSGLMCAEILVRQGGACGSEIYEEELPLIQRTIAAYKQAMGDASTRKDGECNEKGNMAGSADTNGQHASITSPTNTVPTDDPNPSVWNWKNTNDGSKWGTPRIAPKDLPTCEEIIE